MVTAFFSTDGSVTRLVQRVVLGLVILPHGLQKVFGWFGGYGFEATVAAFTGMLGVPLPLVWLVIAAESLGALALIAGLATRLTAFGIASVMTGAVFLTHLPNGFFMNWTGQQGGEGFEYHLLALALALPLVVAGGGALSVDRWIAARLGRREQASVRQLAAHAVPQAR